MKLFRSAKRVAVQEPEAAPVDAEQQGATPVAVPADGGMSGSLGIFAKLGDVLVQAGVVSAEQVDESPGHWPAS